MARKNSLPHLRTSMSATALTIAAAAFVLGAPTASAYNVSVTGQVLPGNIGDPNQYYQTNQQGNGATSISLDSGVITGAYFLELSGHVTGSSNLATGTLTATGQGNTTLLVQAWMDDALTFHLPAGMASTVVHFSLQVQGIYSQLNLLDYDSSAGISLGGVAVAGNAAGVPDVMNQTLSGELTVTDGSPQGFSASLQVLGRNFGSVPFSFRTNPSARITLQLEPGVSFTSQSGVFLSQSSASATYRLKDLGTLGGTYSQGLAINASGSVIGYAFNLNQQYKAFIWNGTAMTDLGSLGGFRSEIPSPYYSKMNASGKVTGYSYLADSTYHAFRWDGSTVQDLGTLGGGRYSQGNAINASGAVAGQSYLADDATAHAFVTNGASLQDLGTFGGTHSSATAINDAGRVTGWAHTADGRSHAFLWDGTTMQDLGTLGGNYAYSEGRAINSSGQITGVTTTPGNELHAFLWDGTSMQDLGFLGGTNIEPMAINASGQVAGRGALAGDAPWHAFLWNGNSMQDLGTLGGANSYVYALNDTGQVVGHSDIDGTAVTHAFLSNGTTMQDLNDLIDPADPSKPYVTLNEATGINELGQIIANGCDTRTSECHAYLVSPVTATDPTAPSITPNLTGTQGANGWYTSDVNVTWSVTDAESAISSSTGCDAAAVATDTTGQIFTCTATSAGGTASQSATIKRDTAAPTATATPAPMPNVDGWNKADVTVTFAGTDPAPGSGIASCTPAAVLSTEGLHSGVQGHCSDLAGFDSNNAVAPNIRIDKTAPTVTGSRTPAPNGADWNRATVTVEFSATDNLSGVPAGGCDSPTYLSSDGAGQSVTGQCHDLAGNTGSAAVNGINIDTTRPVATAGVAPAPNANGWNNTSVVVSFSATDNTSGSGIATCSSPVTVSGEGLTSGTQGFCTDIAGNDSNSAVAPNLHIDKTAPTVIVTTPSNGGTYLQGATVPASFVCSDSLSGPAANFCAGPVANGSAIDTATTGSKSFTVSAADLAGNTRSTTNAYTVVTPPPSIQPVLSGTLGDNGWYRSTVSLSWQVTSPYSPITSTSGCKNASVNKDTTGTTYTCSATNSGGTTSKSVTIKRDATAPAITITTPKNKASYARGSTVASAYTCNDATAGIATTQGCVGTVPNGTSIDTATFGAKSFSVNAKDQAGNTASKTVSYSVK